MSKGKLISSVLSILFVLCVSYIAKNYDLPESSILSVTDAIPQSLPSIASNSAIVSRVIDGDTIEISSGEKVRLIGIDTPETVDPRRGLQCFGKKASEYTKELLLDKEVILLKDISETDKYGRLLRYVYIGDIFINEKLVREGYAKASTYPPDVKYAELFKQAQVLAQADKKGLWKECPTS